MMPKAIWQCNRCEKVFTERKDAVECEKEHIKEISLGEIYHYDINLKLVAYNLCI